MSLVSLFIYVARGVLIIGSANRQPFLLNIGISIDLLIQQIYIITDIIIAGDGWSEFNY